MNRKFSILIFLLLLVLIGACTDNAPLQPPEPTLEVVNLQIEPAIAHWLPEVSNCADQLQNFGIYTQVLPQAELNPENADLVLRLGERLETDPYVTIMGVEELVVVAGDSVPITLLSKESLQAIFTGAIVNWGSVAEILQEDFKINQPIGTLSYPDRHVLRVLFEATYLGNQSIAINPQIFSTIDYVQILLQNDPFAIGFLIKSQVPTDVKTLTIIGFDTQAATHYVLAVTSAEPEGKLKQFLLCLQNSQ